MQQAETGRGFSLFEEALLVFGPQDWNAGQYMKVVAAVQSAIQCYHVIYNKKRKDLLPRHHWIAFFFFFQEGR